MTFPVPTPEQAAEIEHVKAFLPVTEFWSADGGCMLMDMADQTYIIRVDTNGASATTYLSTEPLAEIVSVVEDTYTAGNVAEIQGWSPGWEC